MDRKLNNYLLLPFVYFFLLSLGLIVSSGYLLNNSGYLSKSFAKEIDSSKIDISLSKSSDQSIEITEKSDKDIRIQKIDAFFSKHDAPLAGYGEYFVKEADRFKIDWKITAAIAWCESNGGKSKTAQAYKNAWGWGIRDGAALRDSNVYENNSWEKGIFYVSEGIKYYYDDGLIEPVELVTKYNPSSVNRAGGDPSKASWTICIDSTLSEISNQEI